MAQDFVCPSCKEPLSTWICSHCGTDVRDLFKAHTTSNDQILQALVAAGTYYVPSKKHLVVSGHAHWSGWEGGANDWDNHNKFRIWLAGKLNCTLNSLSVLRLDQFWTEALNMPAIVPHVAIVGHRPMLLEDPDGQLYFPQVSTLQSRFFHGKKVRDPHTKEPTQMVTLYQGPPLTPQDHGGLFERFLSTFRCVDEDNRHVLRSWCYAAMVAHLVPEGQFPALIIASNDFGAGKTTVAECLMELFGGGLSVLAKQLTKTEDFMRMVMTEGTGFLLADNLRNEGGRVIDDSDLAALITMKDFSTKTLFKTSGSYTVPNRLNVLLTANQPMFSPELLSRMMVATLRKPTEAELEQARAEAELAGEKRSWKEIWLEQRFEIVEDLMWHVIQNWNQGPFGAPNCKTRFVDWWRVASRALRAAPMVTPRNTALTTALQRALYLLWREEQSDRLPVDGIIERLRAKKHGDIGNILRQRSWTEALVVEDLQLYGNQFQIEVTKEEQLFIVKRY